MSALRILIAEDDPDIGRLLDVVLTGVGHLVTVTATGEDAVATFDAGRFDIVLLDVMLPGAVDGYDACRHIRAASPCGVVMLTARSSEDDHFAGFQAGADAYVTKPFRPRELLEIVADIGSTSPDARARHRADEQRKASFLRSLEHRF